MPGPSTHVQAFLTQILLGKNKTSLNSLWGLMKIVWCFHNKVMCFAAFYLKFHQNPFFQQILIITWSYSTGTDKSIGFKKGINKG